jgi:hypothetical protein
VFEVRPVAVSTEIDVQGYLSAPTCDLEGCVFGTPAISAQATVAGAATVPFTNLLPKGAILGEWRTKGFPAMTTIADAPSGYVVVNGVQAQRKGRVTYVWQPIPAGFDISTITSYVDSVAWPEATLLDQWLLNNPLGFNAGYQSGSPDLLEQAFVNGQCAITNAGIVAQDICNLFQHWQLSPTTDMRQGRLVLQPRVWSYIATANIVEGELLQRVFTGCPEFNIVSFTDGYQQWTVTNSLPTPVTAELTVTVDLSLCPPVGAVNINLLPKQAISQIIFGCPSAVLNLFAIATDGFTTPCEANRNISYSLGAQANVQFSSDSTTANPVLSTSIGNGVVAAQQQTLALLMQIAPILSTDLTPDLTILDRQTQLDAAFAQYNATLASQIALSQSTQPTSNQQLQAYLTDFQAASTQQALVIAQFANTVREVSNATAHLDAVNALLNVQTNSTLAALQNEKDKFQADLDSRLQDHPVGLGTNPMCNWCGNLVPDSFPVYAADWICPILCDILTILLPILIFACLICCCIQCVPALLKSAT